MQFLKNVKPAFDLYEAIAPIILAQQLQLHSPAHVDRGHGRTLEDVEHAAVGQAVGARQALHGLVAAHGLDQPVILAANGRIPRAA